MPGALSKMWSILLMSCNIVESNGKEGMRILSSQTTIRNPEMKDGRTIKNTRLGGGGGDRGALTPRSRRSQSPTAAIQGHEFAHVANLNGTALKLRRATGPGWSAARSAKLLTLDEAYDERLVSRVFDSFKW